MNVYLVGCGGIGGWLANALAKTLKEGDTLTLIDGDELEEKNLDRQLFTKKDLGLHKAIALENTLDVGARCSIEAKPVFLGGEEEIAFAPGSIVLVGADNHPARLRALVLCDDAHVPCISAANGYEDAEAFYYDPAWKDTPLDPRQYYPELVIDKTDDPLAPPCTGKILETTPQLAIANLSAASYAMWLLWFWTEKASELRTLEAQKLSPVHVTSSAGRMRVITMGDFDGGKTTAEDSAKDKTEPAATK